MSKNICRAKNPATCWKHGNVEHFNEVLVNATKEYNSILIKSLGTKVLTEEYSLNIERARRNNQEAQTRVDAFDEEYRALTRKIDRRIWEKNLNENNKLNDPEWWGLNERRQFAQDFREKHFNDASSGVLLVLAEFPLDKAAAIKALDVNNCGPFVGIAPTTGPDGKMQFNVLGKTGFLRFDSKGRGQAVGMLHPTSNHEDVPEVLRDICFNQHNADNGEPISWKAVRARTDELVPMAYGSSAVYKTQIIGYNVITDTHSIITAPNGNVITKTTLMTL